MIRFIKYLFRTKVFQKECNVKKAHLLFVDRITGEKHNFYTSGYILPAHNHLWVHSVEDVIDMIVGGRRLTQSIKTAEGEYIYPTSGNYKVQVAKIEDEWASYEKRVSYFFGLPNSPTYHEVQDEN